MEIVEKEIGSVIEIEENIKMMKMPKVMGKNYTDLFDYLRDCNVNKNDTTMPYTRYVNIDWDQQTNRSVFGNFIDVFTKKWHFFTGIPATKKLENKDRIKSNSFKNQKYLRTIHFGPYQKVGNTYGEMWKYSVENGLKLKSESFEFYKNDPTTVKKEEIETEVLIPIV